MKLDFSDSLAWALKASEFSFEEVDRLLEIHRRIPTLGLSGSHQQRQQDLLRSCTVLLAGRLEAFFETVFEEAAQVVFPRLESGACKSFFSITSQRLNNATPANVERLFLQIGMPRFPRHVARLLPEG